MAFGATSSTTTRATSVSSSMITDLFKEAALSNLFAIRVCKCSAQPPPASWKMAGMHNQSSPRKRGGGFTLEVQHLSKGLSRGAEVKAFARGVVVGGDEIAE